MMRIIGRGLVARSLEPYAAAHDGTVAFATGVASSTSEDEDAYARELEQLTNVIDAARRLGERVVYFSGGGAIYGDWSRPAREDDPPGPRTMYGRHQVHCERLLATSGVPHVVLRLPNVIGPSRNRDQLLPSFVAQVLGGTVTVQSGATRDLIAGTDFARVASAVLDRVAPGTIVNVASGTSIGAAEIVSVVARELGRQPKIEVLDGGTSQRFSIERLKAILGDDPFPRPYPVEEIVAREVRAIARTLTDART